MSFSIHTAKLNRELVGDFSTRNLDITKTALHIILRLTPFVDHDGRIQFDKEIIRREMFIDRNSFDRALQELQNTEYKGKKLLSEENGYYVSSFHTPSNGKKTYLNHLPIFNSAEFLSLSLNQTRLFLYIATLNVNFDYKKVAVENLYKNKLHGDNCGVSFYDSYQDMVKDLFFLIDSGFVSVRLPGESLILDKDTVGFKEAFHKKCGFVNNRKQRTSKYHKTKHVIGLKVYGELSKEKANSNKASESEIRLLGERFNMFHEDIQQKTFNFFIEKKNSLMEEYGVAGLQIYRNSLEKYFSEKNENIVYYDQLDKAVNYFTDFYLLEEIKKVILAALKFELGDRGALASTGYPLSDTKIPSLVDYFVTYASDEHKVLIDQDIQLINEAHELMSDISGKEPWTDLSDSIEAVYVRHTRDLKEYFTNECLENNLDNPEILFKKVDSKELIVSLANKSLLSKQKTLDEEADKLKKIVRFYRKKKIPLIPSVNVNLFKEERSEEHTSELQSHS